jgi:hypothetical protein
MADGRGAPSRREVLAGAGSLAFLSALPPARAAELRPRRGVQVAAELEPLVRLLEETPREKMVPVMLGKIRAGARYGDLLAATLLAGARGIRARPVGFELHCVLAVSSAHLAAQAAADERERWLPLLWAMDNFKRSQEIKRGKGEGGWVMPDLAAAKVPGLEQARPRFVQAMDRWDEEGADLAIAALARQAPAAELRELLFGYGARDLRDLGHKAIYAANACRTLDVIGWRHAEPVLRSVTFACLAHDGGNPARGDAAEDRPFRENVPRAAALRAGWSQGRRDDGAARALAAGLRAASPGEASQAVAELLGAGVDPASVWDGLHLFAAELVLRHAEIVSLHALTTTNALHHAFQTSGGDALRRRLLLHAPAFLAAFRGELGDDGRSGPHLDTLAPAPGRSDGHPAELLATIGQPELVAPRRALALLEGGALSMPDLLAAAQRLVFLKGSGAHDYKFSSAAFEDVRGLAPRLRPRFLAATLMLLPAGSTRENPLITQARAILT